MSLPRELTIMNVLTSRVKRVIEQPYVVAGSVRIIIMIDSSLHTVCLPVCLLIFCSILQCVNR